MELDKNILVLPKLSLSENEVSFDMKNVNYALSRQEEISFVTQDKAPELMGAFLQGFADAKKFVAVGRYELNKAKILFKRRYAILAKDVIPSKLKELSFKDTKNNLDIFITLDSEYQQLEESVAVLDAIVEDLEGRCKAIELAYQAVKKVYNTYQPPNLNISGPKEHRDSQFDTSYKFLGKPRY